jgi:hypothetical protein
MCMQASVGAKPHLRWYSFGKKDDTAVALKQQILQTKRPEAWVCAHNLPVEL